MPQYPLENGSLLHAKVCWKHSSCGLMHPQIRAQSYIRGGRAGFQAHLVIWPTTLEQWTTCATVHGGPAKPNWNSFHHDEWDHILSIASLTTQKQGQGKVPAVLCKFPSWVTHRLQTSYLKTSVFPSVETSSCVSWHQCPPDDGPRHQKNPEHSTGGRAPYFMDEGTKAKGQECNGAGEDSWNSHCSISAFVFFLPSWTP